MSQHMMWIRRLIGFPVVAALVLVATMSLGVANPAQAQDQGDIGASAIKNCPGESALIGSTVTCTFIVANLAAFPGEITSLTETNPDPGTPVAISCTLAGGTVLTAGDTLGAGTLCAGTLQVTIPNDPALCGTSQTDRVNIDLQYTQFTPPLVSGAFATHTFDIICPPTPTNTPTNTPPPPPPPPPPTLTPTDTPTGTLTATDTPTNTPAVEITPSVGGEEETPIPGATPIDTSTQVVPNPTATTPIGLPNTGASPGLGGGSGLLAAVLLTVVLAGTSLYLRRRTLHHGR
jgi:hypothetical protein